MKGNSDKLYTVGRFAKLAGVSIRTLRYYDEKGLLIPSGHRESGYRLYSLNDLVRLEQILTLKFIGLSLEQIGEVLADGELDLERILELQQQVVDGKIRHLTMVARALENASGSLRKNGEIDWNDLVHIIRVVKMENSKQWREQFFTDEQRTKIQGKADSMSEKEMLDSQNRWNVLIEEVRARIGTDPASPDMQPLIDRWLGLINEFTQGDEGIRNSLNTMYSSLDSAPPEFREYHERNREVYAFMQKAIEARK